MTDSSVTAKRETVRLVPDLPADDDEFAGHGHSTVAHAIAQLIKKEHGGRVIGLEGTWGSGKSTIVSLVRRELEAQPARSGGEQTRVAIFDAWAHQGDPLRRTFLESLLTHLVGWEWLTKKQARNFRNKFTGKTSTAIIKSTPRFTWEGRAASAAVLLIPLGAAAFDNHFSHFHHLLIYAGLVLAVSPILVVLGFAVALRLLHWRGKCTDTEAFSFFTEDQVKETTTKSIERGEPTSVEFERFFRKILGATINEQRRCVLVLDNLDRVGQADARSIIATMQTFTGMPASSTDDHWRSRVWTLIPYDPDGLGHLWESGSETAEEGSGEDPSAAKGNTRAAAVTVADAFLEKLFEVRFSTPRVVHSDWRQYLTHLLSEAFPNRSPEELRRVAGLRVQYPSASPTGRVALEEPTPRQLKQYVNAIGAILRGTSAVPLIDVAYYCLLQRRWNRRDGQTRAWFTASTCIAALSANERREG